MVACESGYSCAMQVEQLQRRLQEREAESSAAQEAQRSLAADCHAAQADRDRLQQAHVSIFFQAPLLQNVPLLDTSSKCMRHAPSKTCCTCQLVILSPQVNDATVATVCMVHDL